MKYTIGIVLDDTADIYCTIETDYLTKSFIENLNVFRESVEESFACSAHFVWINKPKQNSATYDDEDFYEKLIESKNMLYGI